MIRKARQEDVEAIIKIIDSVHIKNISNKENGFLASENLSESFYLELINNYEYCYVYEVNNEIVGFLIAYSNDFMNEKMELDVYFINNYPDERFVYIFQIGVDPNYQRKNIGSELYEKLFKEAHVKNFKVITSKEPFNKASRLFHQKLGFKDEGVFKWSDGVLSYIYGFKIDT